MNKKQLLAAAAHETELAKAETEMASDAKSKFDAAEDSDSNKAYFGKAQASHTKMADLHKKQAESYKADAEACKDDEDMSEEDKKKKKAKKDAEEEEKKKTQSSDFVLIGKTADGVEVFKRKEAAPEKKDVESNADGSGLGVADLVNQTTTGLVKSALDMLKSDPTIQDEIRKMVLQGVQQALGSKTVPDFVRGVVSDNQLITRPGQKTPEVKTADVPPEFQHLAEGM